MASISRRVASNPDSFTIKLTPYRSDDVQALEEALAALRAILHESGLGALPVDPSQLTSITSRTIARSAHVMLCYAC